MPRRRGWRPSPSFFLRRLDAVRLAETRVAVGAEVVEEPAGVNVHLPNAVEGLVQGLDRQDPADEEVVIAEGVAIDDGTFDVSDAIGDQGRLDLGGLGRGQPGGGQLVDV